MICLHCRKANLPGGVRCVYCGTPFPPKLDFEINAPVGAATPTAGTTGKTPTQPQGTPKRGLVGLLAVLALKAKMLFGLLKIGKILLTFSSMLLFIWVYSHRFGLPFAVGFTICIFLHEMGHVAVHWSKGLKATAPMFIPFVGAIIFLKSFPDDPTIESESGAGGPAAGLLAALGCFGIGCLTGSPFWYALAGLGALINLFNMVPFPPLDGSHIGSVFSPKLWNVVLVLLLLVVIKLGFDGDAGRFSGMLAFILIVGFIFRLGRADEARYRLATPTARARMAAVFLGLCVSLTVLGNASFGRLREMRADPTVSNSLSSNPRPVFDAPVPIVGRTAYSVWTNPVDPLAEMLGPNFQIVLWIVAIIGWLVTCYLLAVASKERFTLSSLRLFAGMMAALSAVSLATHRPHAPSSFGISAYLAATLAALIYAGYAANHKKRHVRFGITLLTARALAWSAGGALVVAYAANNLYVLGGVVWIAIVYFALYRWMAPYVLATAAIGLNRTETAIRLLDRALAQRPDSDSTVYLSYELADLNLRLMRGEAALAALDIAARGRASRTSSTASRFVNELVDPWKRSYALMLLDRYDESLACIERILTAGPEGSANAAQLALAHIRLADLTRLRGWPDESLAQVDRALVRCAKTDRPTQAKLRGLRASALVALEQPEKAIEECENALTASRESRVQARASCIQADLRLRAGNPTGAALAMKTALREAPGDLEVRYWNARTLLADGQASEGYAALKDLAGSFPREHWGKVARAALDSAL